MIRQISTEIGSFRGDEVAGSFMTIEKNFYEMYIILKGNPSGVMVGQMRSDEHTEYIADIVPRAIYEASTMSDAEWKDICTYAREIGRHMDKKYIKEFAWDSGFSVEHFIHTLERIMYYRSGDFINLFLYDIYYEEHFGLNYFLEQVASLLDDQH